MYPLMSLSPKTDVAQTIIPFPLLVTDFLHRSSAVDKVNLSFAKNHRSTKSISDGIIKHEQFVFMSVITGVVHLCS